MTQTKLQIHGHPQIPAHGQFETVEHVEGVATVYYATRPGSKGHYVTHHIGEGTFSCSCQAGKYAAKCWAMKMVTGEDDEGGVTDTSREAYRSLNLNEEQRKVYNYMVKSGLEWTRGNLAKAMNRPINSVCGRINELIGKGKVVVVGKGPYGVGGRPVEVLKVVDGGQR